MRQLAGASTAQAGGGGPHLQGLSGPTEASLDLVGNEEHVVLVADPAEALEVALRGGDVTTLTEDRLNQDRSGVSWCRLLLEEELELRRQTPLVSAAFSCFHMGCQAAVLCACTTVSDDSAGTERPRTR